MTVRAAVLHELRLLLVALQFLTRVPVPGWVGFDAAWLNACVRHFPLVGAVVGAASGAVLSGASLLWPPLVAALLAVGFSAWLTGAFHEDGLADTLDALGGAVDRERALAIMKDSRIGSYGAVALVVVLGLRVALLAALAAASPGAAALALVASHALGRGAAVAVMVVLPYAGDAQAAKAKPLALQVAPRQLAVAAVWCALVLGLAAPAGPPPRLLGAAVAAGAVALLMAAWLRRRLGGYTGDGLGATEQLAEVAVLLALSAGWG